MAKTPHVNEERLRRERDLFLRLLELGQHEGVQPVLRDALGLAISATSSVRGYIELYTHGGQNPEWSMAENCSDAQRVEIQVQTSRGIVQEALATGQTLNLAAATLDPRFSGNKSVRQLGPGVPILCTPLGGRTVMGVLYLEGRPGRGSFDDGEVTLIETLAKHIGPLARRILQENQNRTICDPTRKWRERLNLHGIVGCSEALAKVLQQVAMFASFDATVLLTGPSGTGKTVFAQAIHRNSPRRNGAFVELSCANLPENLLQSELFGTDVGAFTDAVRRRGRIRAAEGGTLFFDEVAELSRGSQASLLQFLQSKTYSPLGAEGSSVADVRIIAATNADLRAAVLDKSFREDLFYRLNVAPIRLPPLSERSEDIALLAEHFVEEFYGKHPGHRRVTISPHLRLALTSEMWPGNVRELENTIYKAMMCAVGEGADVVEKHHAFPSQATASEPETFHTATRRFQRQMLEEVLSACDWNVRQAAERLGLVRQHVHTLIKQYDLRREAPRR